MQNHSCAMAKYCDAYAKDVCQGCVKATVQPSTSKTSEIASYILNDVMSTQAMFRMTRQRRVNMPTIKNVIFNDPATIVLWSDGTKTVVKCQDGDLYSAETGLAMAIAKKALGNKGNFNEVFKKWIPDYEKEKIPGCEIHEFEFTVEPHEHKPSFLDKIFHVAPGEITFTATIKKEDE